MTNLLSGNRPLRAPIVRKELEPMKVTLGHWWLLSKPSQQPDPPSSPWRSAPQPRIWTWALSFLGVVNMIVTQNEGEQRRRSGGSENEEEQLRTHEMRRRRAKKYSGYRPWPMLPLSKGKGERTNQRVRQPRMRKKECPRVWRATQHLGKMIAPSIRRGSWKLTTRWAVKLWLCFVITCMSSHLHWEIDRIWPLASCHG